MITVLRGLSGLEGLLLANSETGVRENIGGLGATVLGVYWAICLPTTC